MFGRTKASVGLDIGQHTVRWAAVELSSGRLKEVWSGELIPERGQKSDLLEGAALEKRLKELMGACQKQVSNWNKSVNTAVQGAGTICGYLELPKLTDKELRTAVPSKLAKQLPFPIDEVVLSYIPIPPLDPGTAGVSAILYVVVQKKVVEQRTAMLKAIGLEAKSLQIPALALARAYDRNHDAPKDQLVALIQVGYQFSQLVLVRQGFPYYHRQFASAGADATYAVQMASQSDWKTAEQSKRTYTLDGTEVAIEPFIIKWSGEVKRSIDSFQARQSGSVPVSRAVLVGGGAAWPGLARRLSDIVGLPVDVEEWARLKVEPAALKNADAASFSLAVGLALGDG